MATIRLIPSAYTLSNTNYCTQSSVSNMYTNTDSITNGYFRGRAGRSSNSTYYAFLRGFNFSDVPSNANVTGFTVKIKAYRSSYQATGSDYRIRLASSAASNSAISNTTLSSDITTTSGGTVYEIPTGNLSWSTLSGYGSNFSIEIPLRNSSTSSRNYPYVYVYGAEIEVTYTEPNIAVTGVSLPSTATVEVGSTIQLIPTITPSNATNQSVTWSSNNTAKATVNSSGVVTGVSAGTAVITVTTVDGGYTATCTVTVAAAVTYDYVLTTSLQVGKKYLIANGNTGAVYLLSNESGGSRQLVGVAATVSNNRITINTTTKNKAEFECVRYTVGNDITITVMSDNKYLYTDSSTGLRLNSPATLDRFWHYQDNKFWQFKSTSTNGYTDTSSEYKYYLELNSSNNYTDNHVTSPSIADTNIPSMYIYVEEDGSSQQQDTAYFKVNGTWRQVSQIYKKINGTWVLQTDYDNVFTTGTNYKG